MLLLLIKLEQAKVMSLSFHKSMYTIKPKQLGIPVLQVAVLPGGSHGFGKDLFFLISWKIGLGLQKISLPVIAII
jgi:hypothetical protein